MTCPGMDVALTFAYPGGLRGTVDDFAACGSLAFGPASLDFPSSTLSLDISPDGAQSVTLEGNAVATLGGAAGDVTASGEDRKSTRLNSSHVANSYAVFC